MERSKPNCHIPDTVQTLSEADGGSNLVCSINVKSFHLFKRFCAVYFLNTTITSFHTSIILLKTIKQEVKATVTEFIFQHW